MYLGFALESNADVKAHGIEAVIVVLLKKDICIPTNLLKPCFANFFVHPGLEGQIPGFFSSREAVLKRTGY